MNKQVFTALAVVAASSSVAAFEGMYGGAAVSYDVGKIKDAGDDLILAGAKPKGVGLDVFAGYNHMLSEQALVGVEAFAGYSTLKKTVEGVKFTSPLHAGVAARLGFIVGKETLVFAKLGADYRRTKSSTDAGSIKEGRVAWLAGAGIEYKLNDSMAVRGDYTYTSTKLKKSGINEKFNLHRVSLGVSYSF